MVSKLNETLKLLSNFVATRPSDGCLPSRFGDENGCSSHFDESASVVALTAGLRIVRILEQALEERDEPEK